MAETMTFGAGATSIFKDIFNKGLDFFGQYGQSILDQKEAKQSITQMQEYTTAQAQLEAVKNQRYLWITVGTLAGVALILVIYKTFFGRG